MEDYTKENVIDALLKLPSVSRKRGLVDQRSYLIGILAYRFMMTEHAISNVIGCKRTKINYNKKIVLQLYKDKSYAQNVYVYAQLFPFDFSVIENTVKSERLKRVELDLDTKFYNKLKAAGSILGHTDIRVTVKFLLDKSLKLWEE